MARKEIDNFDDLILSTALDKAEAAALRSAGTPVGVESAREVYLRACAQIGASLIPFGFKYAKSGPRCTRKGADFTHTVSFQADRNNISGHHVGFWMHATVTSPALKQWRTQHLPALRVNDFVAGGMAHRLGSGQFMLEWELVDPKDRQKTIEDAIAFVHSDVLPYFRFFESPESLTAALAQGEIPAFDLLSSVECGIFFGSTDLGQRILDRFLTQRPFLATMIAEAELLPESPYGPGNYAEEVVFLRRTFHLR